MPKKSPKRSLAHPIKPKISKAAFVRSLPTNMSAKDVVAKAKAQGMILTDAYVYNVRATYRSSKASSRRDSSRIEMSSPSRQERRKRGAVTVRLEGARDVEDLLRAVAAELGLMRAIRVLEAEHARVHKLLGRQRATA